MRIILLLFGILCLALARFSGKNWRTPAGIYTLIWIAFCLLPTCVLWTDVDWNYAGLLWIEASCVAFSIGQAIGISSNWKVLVRSTEGNQQDSRKFEINTYLTRIIIIVMFAICAIHIIGSVIKRGFSLTVFFNLESLFAINSASAYNRYHGDNSASIINQLSLIVEYCLPLIGGFSMSFYNEKKEKVLCALSLLPVFIVFFLSNAKAGFIASVMGFVIMYMLGSYIANGIEKHISAKFIRSIVLLTVVFLAVLFISMCLRVGNFAVSTIDYVRNRFMEYMFGQIKAFDEWFANGLEDASITFGTMTYNWFFNLTGLVERHQGVYGYAKSIRTNVFTMFRGILTDFGLFGGMIYCFLRGIVGGYLFKIVHRRKNIGAWTITLMSTTYFFFMFGLFISPWTYTTFFASYALMLVILLFCQLRRPD